MKTETQKIDCFVFIVKWSVIIMTAVVIAHQIYNHYDTERKKPCRLELH